MSLSIGIVGLPNVGKSTLFNALLRQAQAEVSNYPFTTIKPNIGIVEVPDDRLYLLANRLSLSKVIPATIKFVDIAGLVKGAASGQGLGNQFLAHIRECDAICEVIRFFEDPEIAGQIEPDIEVEILKTELIIKDLETLKKHKEKIQKQAKTGDKKLQVELRVIEKLEDSLNQGKLAREISLNNLSKEAVDSVFRELRLLTQKPILYVANVSEVQLQDPAFEVPENFIPISGKTEFELKDLSKEEASSYLQSLGVHESGVITLIREAFKILGLITFYTLKEEEGQIQAWPVRQGTKAQEAGRVIHSDFGEKFIAAEVVSAKDLIEAGSWQKARNQGLVRIEGRDYIVQDDDIIYFKIGP